MPKTARGWSARFARPLVTKSGRVLGTLDDARGYALQLPDARQHAWTAALQGMLAAAGGTLDLATARQRIKLALLTTADLDLQAEERD